MKRHHFKKYFPKIIFACVLSLIAMSSFGNDRLNGKTFTIKLSVSGDKREGIKWTTDELHFHDGTFTSSFMSTKEKFPSFEYKVISDSTSDEKISLEATGQNPGGSTISWEITITGKSIEGIATWTNMHGPQKEIFKGSLKEKK
jgi:hypothetical protein